MNYQKETERKGKRKGKKVNKIIPYGKRKPLMKRKQISNSWQLAEQENTLE